MAREQARVDALPQLGLPMASRGMVGRATSASIQFLRRKPLGAFGLAVIVLMFLLAVLAPVVSTSPPDFGDPRDRILSPSGEHFFGTDHYGRDVYSRIVYGARISLLVGFGSLVLTLVVATALGLVSGYFGGLVDMVLQRFIDAAMAFPALVLLLVLVSVFGAGLWQMTISLGVLGSLTNTRIVRGAVMSVRNEQYIDAVRVLGGGNLRILLRHILPNIFGPLMVLGTAWLGVAIVAEASLAYLGLGIPPPTPSWGRMLNEARPYMLQTPTLVVFPGIAIALAVFAFNVLGDALRDVLDPRMRGRD